MFRGRVPAYIFVYIYICFILKLFTFTKLKCFIVLKVKLNKYWSLLAPFPGQDSGVVKFPVQFKIAANLATISFISYA